MMKLLKRALLGACVAFLAFTAVASAANYDLRGEWAYKQTCEPSCPVSESQGTVIIRTQNAGGAYSGTVGAPYPGTLSGTVSGETMSLSVTVTTPIGQQSFTMPTGAIDSATNEFSGSGYYNAGGPTNPTGKLTAKRVRTIQQVEEQEAREKAEREGRAKGEEEGLEKGEAEGREKGAAEGKAEGKAKAEQEVKQKGEQETRERQAKEAQAKTEKEAREKTEKEGFEKANQQAREKVEREAREKVDREAREREKKKHKHKSHKRPKHKSAKKA